LSPAEKGIYVDLLCLMYEEGGPIPRDDARLSRRCGCPKASFRRALKVLIDAGKIHENGSGMLFNSRVSEELDRIEKRRDTARKGANARWRKFKQNQHFRCSPAELEQSSGNVQRDAESILDMRHNIIGNNPSLPTTTEYDCAHDAEPLTEGGGGGSGAVDFVDELLRVAGLVSRVSRLEAERWIARWRELGLSQDDIVRHVVAEATAAVSRGSPVRSLQFFDEPMRRLAGAANAPALRAISGGKAGDLAPRDARAEARAAVARVSIRGAR